MTKKLTKFSSYLLTFILGAAIGAGAYGIADNLSSKKLDDDHISTEQPGGLILPDETEGKGVKLVSTAIPAEQFADYAVPLAAESAFTLTATLTPADSAVKDFTWTNVFKNPGSSWASGKNASDYVSIMVDPDTPLKCTVTCLQPFAEPVEIKITYDSNPSIFATAQADYVKRVTDVTFVSYQDLGDFEQNDVDIWHLEITYGIGTVQGEFTILRVGAELSDDFMEKFRTDSFYKQWGAYIKSVDDDHLTPDYENSTLKDWLPSYNKYTNVPTNGKVGDGEGYALSFSLRTFLDDEDKIYDTVKSTLKSSGIELDKYIFAACYNAISQTSKQYRLVFECKYIYTVNGDEKGFYQDSKNDIVSFYSDYYDIKAESYENDLVRLRSVDIDEKNLYL